MTRIRIWESNSIARSLELPVTRDIKMSGEMEYEEVTMVSGKRVMDARGYREKFTAHWDWFPSVQFNTLLTWLRVGGYFNVNYPSETGDASGFFKVEHTSGTTIFKFVNGVPMWHDVTLEFTARDVISV